MVNTPVNTYSPDIVSPPGETLRELLEERGMTQAELCKRMDRPEKTLSGIITGKTAITPDTALQLELVLGIPASFWMVRESHYRESLSRRIQDALLEKEVDWIDLFPVSNMVKYGWIKKHKQKKDQVRELLAYFNVSSSHSWKEMYQQTEACFRKSKAFEPDPGALSAWLQRGLLEANRIKCNVFDKSGFRECLYEIRRLSRTQPSCFIREVRERCSEVGVAVVFVPQLPKTRASGATRWISPTKALIQVSLRYKTNDHFWFTFFHEAGHILLHRRKPIFLELPGTDSPEEREANKFAADLLIPPRDYRKLLESGVPNKMEVEEFAEVIGVAPGIIVGRLQYDEIIPYNYFNPLKLKYEWVE